MWKLALFSASLLSICTQTLANENVVNGDFSSGAIAPWSSSTNAAVSTSGDSPFTNVYASNGKCMQITKPSSSKGYAGGDLFGGVYSGTVTVNFDFRLQRVNRSQDVVAVQKNLALANAAIFRLGTSSGQFAMDDGSGDIVLTTLATNTWYNVNAVFNLTNWTYSGTLTRYGGSAVTWSNRALMGSPGSLGNFLIDEWNPGSSSNVINFDNFSVRTGSINKHSAMLLNGKPYFPIGVYGSPAPAGQSIVQSGYNRTNAMEMAAAGINNYSMSMASLTDDEFNYAEEFGLTIRAACAEPPVQYMKYTEEFVVGSSFDQKIQMAKNHPSLLAYYGIDEPLGRSIVCEPGFDWLSVVMAGKNFVASRDPNHILMLNEVSYAGAVDSSYTTGEGVTYTYTPGGFASYSAGGDMYGMDTYPYNDSSSDLTFPEKDVDNALNITSSSKPVMSTLQGQANGEAAGDFSKTRPDLTATRFMAYSTVIHGTNGIFWWGLDWVEADSQIWKDVKSVARELNDIQDVLTYGSDSTAFTLGNPNLEGVLKSFNGYHYLIVANRSFGSISNATITSSDFVPANNNSHVAAAFESGASSKRCRLISASGSSWTDSFVPWGVHVYTDKPTILRASRNDFDADGRSDIAGLYLGSDNIINWDLVRSRCTDKGQARWGGGSDIPISSDFDGDGKADFGVFSNGTWNILKSSTGDSSYYSIAWGSAGDTPVVGDFDGDGVSDMAVFSGKNWHILTSSSGFTASMGCQLGNQANGDIPVSGDFDGDGKTDIAVFSGGHWRILKSSSVQSNATEINMPAFADSASNVESKPVELITNGDFSGSSVSPWQISDGIASVSATVNSPFTCTYKNNGRSMIISKPANSISLAAVNNFSPVTGGKLRINFDFKMSALTGSWETLVVESPDGTSAPCVVVMDAMSNHFVLYDASSVHIAQLSANTWYNVQMNFDLDTWTYSGSLTAYRGQSYTWSSRPLSGAAGAIGRLHLTESNASTAAKTIYYDNFSVASYSISNLETLQNGDFSTGTISPWEVSTGSVTAAAGANSPSTNAYADNNQAMVVSKSAGVKSINATAAFNPVDSGLLKINYDFKMSAINGSWEVFGTMAADASMCAFVAIMDGTSNHFILYDGDPSAHITNIEANTWYNVQITLDLNTWTYSGSITKYGGFSCPSVWSGRKLSGNPCTLGLLTLDESNPSAPEKTIYYDNFSVIPVPTYESSTVSEISIPEAKALADETTVCVSGIVTAVFADCFYIENAERSSGIMVNASGSGLSIGSSVKVIGTMGTANGERVINTVSEIINPDTTGYSISADIQWGGSTGDIPVVGDFDGDGRDDITVYNGGYWHILKSSSNFTTSTTYVFGGGNDMPICGDCDGDGISDLIVVSKTVNPVRRWLGSASGFTRGGRYILGCSYDYIPGSSCYK